MPDRPVMSIGAHRLARELGDRVEQGGAAQRVVVVGADDAEEALGLLAPPRTGAPLARRGRSRPGRRERRGAVRTRATGAPANRSGRPRASPAGRSAGGRRSASRVNVETTMTAPQAAAGGDLDGDRPAEGFTEARDRGRIGPSGHQVVESGGRVEIDAPPTRRALAAPVAAIVVGEYPESAGGQRRSSARRESMFPALPCDHRSTGPPSRGGTYQACTRSPSGT